MPCDKHFFGSAFKLGVTRKELKIDLTELFLHFSWIIAHKWWFLVESIHKIASSSERYTFLFVCCFLGHHSFNNNKQHFIRKIKIEMKFAALKLFRFFFLHLVSFFQEQMSEPSHSSFSRLIFLYVIISEIRTDRLEARIINNNII